MLRDISIPGFTLGILGAGQLGRMMALDARRMGIKVICLDPSPRPPALGIADLCLQGDLYNKDSIRNLAMKCDVLTYEIEHIDALALASLEEEGYPFLPSPKTLGIIQDKLLQKEVLAKAGLPLPKFANAQGQNGEILDPRSLGFKYPLIQKARKGGYDGRGVLRLDGPSSLGSAITEASYFEDLVDFRMELSLLLARDARGRVEFWPLIEMIFDPETQICTMVAAPARVPERLASQAQDIALAAVEALDGVGVFAVELFLDRSSQLYVNEIAPRPHNSGHWTIEGSMTSQFEQHVRAVCGLPLGSTRQFLPAVTLNLLGQPGSSGEPRILGCREALALPGLSLHWYEKASVSTQRKMGHLTVLATSLEEALEIARKAESLMIIEGGPPQEDGSQARKGRGV